MAVLEGQIRFLLRPTGMKIQYGQTMFLKVRSSAPIESLPQPAHSLTHPACWCFPHMLPQLLCQGEFNEIGIMRVHEVWRGTTFVSPEVLRSARPIPK